MNRRTSLLAAMLTALGVQAYAQTPTAPPMPGVDQRQEQQARRIDQGQQSGALTEREAGRLERGQARIQAMEGRAEADGTVTPQERRRLHQAQDTQSRHIYREKHDRQHDFNHDGKLDRPRRLHRPS
ncbi:MAG: hypothetical protein IOMNBAOH_01992 [Rhodocyclaceae bacterium]|nr:hypothetical protein [Rhodocyclaceae bacterium]